VDALRLGRSLGRKDVAARRTDQGWPCERRSVTVPEPRKCRAERFREKRRGSNPVVCSIVARVELYSFEAGEQT
jgi:hypothetical protein